MGDAMNVGGDVKDSVLIQGNNNNASFTFVSHNYYGTRPTNESSDGPAPGIFALEFDRGPQKDALRPLWANLNKSVTLLSGPRGQGQRIVAEYLFQKLLQADQVRRRIRIGHADWPSAASIETGVGQLCEQLGRRWLQAPRPTGTPAELLALVDRHEQGGTKACLLVHHTLLMPTRADADLIDRYLNALWLPIFQRPAATCIPTLVFELRLGSRGPWASKLYRLLGLGDEGARAAILEKLQKFAQSADARFAPTPDHLPLSTGDIELLLPREPHADPNRIRARARQIYEATRGDFEAVVAELYPSEAI